MVHHHVFREEGPRPLSLLVSSDTANVNLFTLAGSPGSAVKVTVVVASGVTVFSSSASAAFTTGAGWAAGSVLTLINNGSIIGRGGAGGHGGNGSSGNGSSGSAGGVAVELLYPLTIDNTYGSIGGGGGGGGGGAGGYNTLESGGGGGGGQGRDGGLAGSRGTPGSAQDGAAGTQSSPGGGGAPNDAFCGHGGAGGTLGQNGHQGGTAAPGGNRGGGGPAGAAVNLNSNPATWLGGNNPTQVKGAVS